MKKLLAMTLAVAMVLSLAAVSFASSDVTLERVLSKKPIIGNACYYNNDKDVRAVDYKAGYKFAYGETMYFPLISVPVDPDTGNVTDAEDLDLVFKSNIIDGLKVKTDFDFGEKYVDSVKLTQKKSVNNVRAAIGNPVGDAFEVGEKYVWYVAVELKDTMKTDVTDVIGELQFDKKATRNKNVGNYEGSDHKGKYDDEFDYDVTTAAIGEDVQYVAPEDEENVVKDKRKLYTFGDKDDDEYELYFVSDNEDIATFTFDARGQQDMVLSANNDFNAAISAKYPTANLEFLNVEASDSFNKLGTLRVYAEDGYHLYALNSDGEIVNAKAKYDEDDECYVMRTRTLGSFVLADEELEVSAPVAPVVPEVKPEVKPFNPGTGAAC